MSDDELPKDPVHLVRITKTGGLTIPKEIRDNFEDKTPFALSYKGNKLIFQQIKEEDVDKLILAKGGNQNLKKALSTAKTSERSSEGERGFDPASYLVYEFENSDKTLKALELSYKFFEENDIEQAFNYVKVAIVKYVNGKKVNDARLYYSIILFLCDVIIKQQKPNLIEYIRDNLIGNVESKIIKEQSLSKLIAVSIQVGRMEKAREFVQMVLDNIRLYKKDELFFIMDSLKQLVRTLRTFVDVNKDTFSNVKDRILEYATGITYQEEGKEPQKWEPFDVDYRIQLIDLLEQMRFIEDAHDLAENTLKSLPEDSMKIEELKKILRKLRAAPIE